MDIEQQQFGDPLEDIMKKKWIILDRIAKDYEEVLNENIKYKEEMKLQARLEEYSRIWKKP